jgi:FMN phosphatase YigB (HAD superfamily)
MKYFPSSISFFGLILTSQKKFYIYELMRSKFKGLLFDFGNTLFPFRKEVEADRFYRRTYSFLNKLFSSSLSYQEFKRRREALILKPYLGNPPSFVETTPQRVAEELAEAFTNGKACSKELISKIVTFRRRVFCEVISLPENLPSLLNIFSLHYCLGIVSNYPDPVPILRTLKKFKLLQYFKSVIVSGEVGYVKPHAAPFKRALQELNLHPEETLYIGDNWYTDILGASKLGMATAYIYQWLSESEFREGLKKSQPNFLLPALSYLKQVLKH